jgi:hypothetical protein
LTDEKARANGSGVYLACLFIYNGLLGLNHCAGLAFIIDSNDLRPQLEFSSFGGGREWFQELDQALAVDDTSGVELGHTGDWIARLRSIEVDDFLGGLLERCRKSIGDLVSGSTSDN